MPTRPQLSSQLQSVVIAGGSGTRFWPLSRRHRPKQLVDLSGHGSLLAGTFERVAALTPAERQWMVVGEAHADGCRQACAAISADRVLVEPVGRNTAPAIALAAIHLLKKQPGCIMVVLPADHHVQNARAFCAAVEVAASAAQQGSIVTLGIRPSHPETGYGYIERGDALAGLAGVFRVRRFCEKPSLDKAQQFIRQGGFDWNAGIFIMTPAVYMAEVERQLPELHAAMQEISAAIGTPHYERVVRDVYARIKGISIDYGIMEGARQTAVVPVDCGWSDVGSWSALGSIVDADDAGNVVHGRAVLLDSKNCTAYATAGHAVAVVGLEGVVVVHTPDATLVVPAHRAQEVREILAEVERRGWKELL